MSDELHPIGPRDLERLSQLTKKCSLREATEQNDFNDRMWKTTEWILSSHYPLKERAEEAEKKRDRYYQERNTLQTKYEALKDSADANDATQVGQSELSTDYNKLKNANARTKSDLNKLSSDHEKLGAKYEALKANYDNVCQDYETLKALSAGTTGKKDSNFRNDTRGNQAKPRMKDPPEFDGKREAYMGWRAKMDIKLARDALTFDSDDEIASYILSRLDGPALEAFVHFIKPDGSGSATCSSFELWRKLDSIYGIKNLKGDAIAKLSALKQDSTPLRDFLTTFQTLINHAGWDDDTAKESLFVKLERSTYHLAASQRHRSFNEIVTFLMENAATEEARERAYGSKSKDKADNENSGGTTRGSTRGNGRRGRGGRGGRGGGHTGSTNDGGKYKDSETNHKYNYGTRDMSGVQCYNCDRYGHLSKDCQEPRKVRAVKVNEDKPNTSSEN